MSAQTFSRTASTIRQTLVRYRWTIALGLLGVVAVLAAYRFSSVPSVITSGISGSQVSHIDPAQQGVLVYLRAHQAVAQTRPLDPAQQGVMSYLHTHAVVEIQRMESAQQGVLGYLHAHSSVQPLPTAVVSLEPAQQGVMSYRRAHAPVVIQPLDPSRRAVLDYLRAHNQ
jgi:hypothetical protein